jgi:two-component system, OmpR family, alkaline phosphatase synthesis response regulator PhoP
MKVLLVDDDQALQTVFSTALKTDGFQIVNAYDGKSALDVAKTEKPDLILLDQVLPDIQGNEILKTLKAEAETANIPVAMLSNFGQNDLIQEAISAGALDYILKYQVEPQDLVKKIKSLVGDQQQPPQAPQ